MARLSTAPVLFPTPLAVLAKVLAAKAEDAPASVLAALNAEFEVALIASAVTAPTAA